MGREGRVMGRTGLSFDLAAYRVLRPGERPQPLLYRNRLRDVNGQPRRELLLRTWSEAPVRLELFNPGATPSSFELGTLTGRVAGVVPAGERLVVDAPVPANVLAVVTIDFLKPVSAAADPVVPLIRLVP